MSSRRALQHVSLWPHHVMSSMTPFEHTYYQGSRMRVRVSSDRAPSFLVQVPGNVDSFSIFTKRNYFISLSIKHNLEIFRERNNA